MTLNVRPVSLETSSYKNCRNIRRNNDVSPCFVSVSKPCTEQKNIAFGGFFSNLFVKKPKPIDKTSELDDKMPDFTKRIGEGVNKQFGTKFGAARFSCVVTPDEFRKILPTLTRENFEYNKDNIKNGIYYADLDNQTIFSTGTDNIFNMTDKAAYFANDYYEKTGKDFIFAITDRDSLEGIKHCLRIVGENPAKFSHIKLVPGIKMSFAHEAPSSSSIGYENSEMLVYGINPFSENINNFLDNVISKRKEMSAEFIKQVQKLYPQFAYNIREFAEQNNLIYKKDYGVSNLYWRAKEYSEKKGGDKVSGHVSSGEKIYEDAESIVFDLDKVFIGSDLSGSVSSITSSDPDETFNLELQRIFDKYSTHYDPVQKKAVSFAENIYEDMIDCFDSEPEKPVLAIASPYYFSHYFEHLNTTDSFDNVIKFFNKLKDGSKGMLCAFESVVPAYGLDKILGPETVEKFNDYLKNSPDCDLYEVGGSFHRLMAEDIQNTD